MSPESLSAAESRLDVLVRPELPAKQEALELIRFLHREFPEHPAPAIFGNEYHSVEIEWEGLAPPDQVDRRMTITIASDGGMFYDRFGPNEYVNPELFGQGTLANLEQVRELVRWMEGQDVPRFS